MLELVRALEPHKPVLAQRTRERMLAYMLEGTAEKNPDIAKWRGLSAARIAELGARLKERDYADSESVKLLIEGLWAFSPAGKEARDAATLLTDELNRSLDERAWKIGGGLSLRSG